MRIYKKLPFGGGTVMGMSRDEIKRDSDKEIFEEMDRILYKNCWKLQYYGKF